jgi:hypothetical protein
VAVLRLGGAAAPAPGWSADGVVLADGPGDERRPRLHPREDGVLVTWTDAGGHAGAVQARAGEVLRSALPELVTRHVGPDRVRLEWAVPAEADYEASVEREVRDGGWQSRRAEVAPGRLAIDEAAARTGERMRYRIRVRAGDLEATMPEIELVVPAPVPLALVAVRGDAGRLRVRFTAPSAGPAELEAFDVQGRRALRTSFRVGEAGEHEREWPLPGELRSGVWYVRLAHGGVSRTARLVLAR